MSGRGHAPGERPVTVPRIRKMKREGTRITMVTAYDAPGASNNQTRDDDSPLRPSEAARTRVARKTP